MMSAADEEVVPANGRAESGEADLQVARAAGKRAGAELSRQSIECPYGHEVLELRTTWFNGFSEGRATVSRD